MTSKEFALALSIEASGEELSNGDFNITLKNSDEYAYYYYLFSKSPLLDLDYENMSISDKESVMPYLGDKFSVYLNSNFDEDLYNIIIKKE